MLKKIAFMRPGVSIPTNVTLEEVLRNSFPEYEIDIIDVGSLLRRDRIFYFLALLAALKDYGSDILHGRKQLRECMRRTPFYFVHVKKILARIVTPEKYEFSFQIQSLFDGSCPGVRHFVYTDHTHLANLYCQDFDKSKLFPERWITLEKSIYLNAEKVFTRSEHISKSVIEQYGCPAAQVNCVYAGSNATHSLPALNEKDYSNPNILFVGLDWHRKGGPTLVNAFMKVLEAYPEAQLTIIGAAPDIQIPNCTVVGKVSLEDVSKYYEKATIFCMPTHLEPFGIVFVEALTYKLPIIATNIGAIPDMVLDDVNGYLLEPGDVDGIARRLIEMVGNPEKCKEFGQKGYELAMERYNWDIVGDRFRENILFSRKDSKSIKVRDSKETLQYQMGYETYKKTVD